VKRRYKWVLAILAALVSLCFLGMLLVRWIFPPLVPRPHSDIPISCELGPWPYQDDLTVIKLSAEAVDPKLNLFNDEFLIRYRVTGAITSRRGWRPKIIEAQVTARLVSRHPNVADISVVPIVNVTEDTHYSEEHTPFDLKLEQIIRTMEWGINRYEIHCLDQTAVVSVQQRK
jgi:hypothetical protein